MQNIVFITSGGISKVENRNIVAVILACNSAIISCHISLCVRTDERHSACTGKFDVRVQEVCGLAHTRSTYHQSVNIAVIYKSNSLFTVRSTANYRTLNGRKILALPPEVRFEWQRNKRPLYLRFRCPPRSSVLSVTDPLGLYSIQRFVIKQIYDH